MKKVTTILGALLFTSFILTSCGGGGSQEPVFLEISEDPAATSEEPAATSEELDNSIENSISTTDNRHWWSCNKCGGLVKMESDPGIDGCPVEDDNGYKYHNWSELGQVGEINYSCGKCGSIIQVTSEPRIDGCSVKDANGYKYHIWSRL